MMSKLTEEEVVEGVTDAGKKGKDDPEVALLRELEALPLLSNAHEPRLLKKKAVHQTPLG